MSTHNICCPAEIKRISIFFHEKKGPFLLLWYLFCLFLYVFYTFKIVLDKRGFQMKISFYLFFFFFSTKT